MKFNIQWLAKGQEKLKKIPLGWVDGVSIGTIFNKFFLEKSLKHLRLSKVHLKQIYFAVVQILTFYESCHCFYREVVETETMRDSKFLELSRPRLFETQNSTSCRDRDQSRLQNFKVVETETNRDWKI